MNSLVALQSVKLSDVTYGEIAELKKILRSRGTNVLPPSERPEKATADGIVLAAVRALRRRVRR